MNEEHNKFMEVEMLLGGLFTLGVDGICFLIDWTGVCLAIAPIIQGFTTFVMWMWFKSKGDPGALSVGRQVAKYASNMLPLLPTTLIAFAVEVYLHNHPEKFGAIQKVAALKSASGAAKAAEGGTIKKALAARKAYREKLAGGEQAAPEDVAFAS
ncbi:hypothetical protein COX26_00210 [Candidatus Jorgensenbacteria bacterium CG23_combo_of_CG06-09_8_20_14_all_54_14]|uniref:Uncharacterized protein n=1 Tax=Candidatus Jorgensenbacteria bacterium CG23_combo_of_CG06-09_8_20_14_all_54_14 TaxID=1974595 RepID=A0A2G9ZAK2_9BACT|nr:MAG: hypothetical protein COX26_00210 [Candidatus Jorgensenbacteria bacterium CG23_combo_of_CG06-09_8_20_14_all_54_14]